jgi:hypothetical protein
VPEVAFSQFAARTLTLQIAPFIMKFATGRFRRGRVLRSKTRLADSVRPLSPSYLQ